MNCKLLPVAPSMRSAPAACGALLEIDDVAQGGGAHALPAEVKADLIDLN